MTAKQLITGTHVPLRMSDSRAFALSIMEELRLCHFPVVHEHELAGVISEEDIHADQDPESPIGKGDIALQQVCADENQHIYDVIRIFSATGISMIPVVNNRRQYLGMITLPSLVKQLETLTAVGNPGGVIVLELNDKDYNLTEIAQIVESNDARILSLYLTSYPESTRIEVTIKLNHIDIGPVLQTFFRYQYNVKASWSDEDLYSQGLQERFDGLMNYLNI
jgi:predicted transcriptional regulator